jgi:hypothetical protein
MRRRVGCGMASRVVFIDDCIVFDVFPFDVLYSDS